MGSAKSSRQASGVPSPGERASPAIFKSRVWRAEPCSTAVSWITAALAHDTGSSTDGLTADDTVSGNVTAGATGTTLKAGSDSTKATKFVDVSAALQPDGSFVLSPALLLQVAGGKLADGKHTLHLLASDASGNVSPQFNLAFTLDTAGPTITAALAKDTGSSAKDGITYDDTVNGKATDTNAIDA